MAKELVLTSHGVQIIQHNLRTHKVQAEMAGLVMNLWFSSSKVSRFGGADGLIN